MYIFPTKALSQDQFKTIHQLTGSLPQSENASIVSGIYDGDTNQFQRKQIRQNARILITNPDMLHLVFYPTIPIGIIF